jgi:5-methylcytosine-specific restriction protein A
MAVSIFDNDDNKYLKWMDSNPSYFVVNTGRTKGTKYCVLHKSMCHHVSTTSKLQKGAYTERQYIKIGSDDLNELHNWFAKNRTKFKGKFSECKSCNPLSDKFLDNPIFLFPDVIENEKEVFFEGAKTTVIVNSYERNYKARQKCLKHYGYDCTICDTNFEKLYGIIGKDFIHVHHLIELNKIQKSYKIDPVNDLRPVCPNCHSMLHQRKPCFTISELRAILKNKK